MYIMVCRSNNHCGGILLYDLFSERRPWQHAKGDGISEGFLYEFWHKSFLWHNHSWKMFCIFKNFWEKPLEHEQKGTLGLKNCLFFSNTSGMTCVGRQQRTNVAFFRASSRTVVAVTFSFKTIVGWYLLFLWFLLISST